MEEELKKEEAKRKIMFLGVTDDENSDNRAYSNIIYFFCKRVLCNNEELRKIYDVDNFKRHDMMDGFSDLRGEIYKTISEQQAYIFLLDEANKNYNTNVAIELGMLASTRGKKMVFLTQNESTALPFYAGDIKYLQIGEDVMEFFNEHKGLFGSNNSVTHQISTTYNNIIKDTNTKIKVERIEKLFSDTLIMQLLDTVHSGNPFDRLMEQVELSRFGYGGVYEILAELKKKLQSNVFANLYTGEREAFQQLTEAVEKAKHHLRTTRFSNQSLIGRDSVNSDIHNKFMYALKEKSKELSSGDKSSERIICNSSHQKWMDIYEILRDGGNIKVYVRQERYNIRFEVVIVDDDITFIHFYQLWNPGNMNDDQTVNSKEMDIINSTLKIEGKNVAEKMIDFFQRLYQKSNDELSTALLGCPPEKDGQIIDNKQQEYGVFQIGVTEGESVEKRSGRILNMLMEKYMNWYDFMQPVDRKNMLEGLKAVFDKYDQREDDSFAKNIEEFSLKKKSTQKEDGTRRKEEQ